MKTRESEMEVTKGSKPGHCCLRGVILLYPIGDETTWDSFGGMP